MKLKGLNWYAHIQTDLQKFKGRPDTFCGLILKETEIKKKTVIGNKGWAVVSFIV